MNEKRKDALAGERGRANEETKESCLDNECGLSLAGGNTESDQNNGGCRRHSGRRRVHGDAQLAVLGGGLILMQVRGLSEGEQRQEDQAQRGDGNPEAMLWHAAFSELDIDAHAHTFNTSLSRATI
jgi:hypothetical protein